MSEKNEIVQPDTVRVSVRSLVEFLLRSGDIDNRSAGMPDKDAMQLGSRLHRKIQGSMGAEYRAEVPLFCESPCEDFLIRVEGRADGIITREKEGRPEVTIDEIKGILRPLQHLEEPVPVHLAQAKCYACMYAVSNGLDEIDVRMTYANLETEETKYFQEHYQTAELSEWFDALIADYAKWAKLERDWKKTRNESIHQVTFPFAYRPGQKKLAGQVYHTIAQEKILFIQAPTGTGKTISTVFPAVKAVGEGLGDKIFYLTAKTIARTVAAEAFDLLCGRGLKFKRIILTAKEKICKCETPDCNPVACPYAKGHFDRINQALYELITQQDFFDRDGVSEAADRYMVCPFELSLDLSYWMDAVIGDYNYAFHPRARLKRFFGEGVKGDYLFLIDETHNLVDRGREMYSAALYKEDVLALKKAVKPYSPKLVRALERTNKALLAMKRECETYQILESTGTLPVTLMNLYGVMEEILDDPAGPLLHFDADARTQLTDLFFEVGTFLDTVDRLDENYVIYDEHQEDGRFLVKLWCVNPAQQLQEVMDKARSSILFSATLLPVTYYMEHLSTRKDNYAVYASSVFDPANLRVLIGADTSSRYTGRTPELYRRIAQYICRTAGARPGNYMVFFPSYRMLEDVKAALLEAFEQVEEISLRVTGESRQGEQASSDRTKIRLLAQHSRMREDEREEFLSQFTSAQEGSLVGLCVMGSFFGEGIDLRRDSLIGVIVVGTGLPMVCTQQEILRDYYERSGKDGFHFAYQCPGMNKVLQAAGRVIRTEEDRGVVVLLDDRFTSPRYRRMFPREWKDVPAVTMQTLDDQLHAFWDES